MYSSDGTTYDPIIDSIPNTGLIPDTNTFGQLCLDATNILPEDLRYSNFYIKADIFNSDLKPEPVHVFFHNAPEVKNGGIVDLNPDGVTIDKFNDGEANDLSRYDTIYIPKCVTGIATSIFSEKFISDKTGVYKTIQNIIFADRNGTCDVGADAFSSTTNLVLTGGIYIGCGIYTCSATTTRARFFSAYSDYSLSITMGDVTILGNCSSRSSDSGGTAPACFFSAYSGGTSASTSIVMGGVTINGDCSSGGSGGGSGAGYFFSADSSGDSSVAITGDVTINGNCSSGNGSSVASVSFFSAYSSNSSSDSSVVITGDVTINGNCISSGSASPACFFSAASSGDSSVAITGDVTINGNCSSGNSSSASAACFFSADSSGDSSVAITGDVTINGNCSSTSANAACFFSADSSGDSSLAITGDVTIDGNCSSSGDGTGEVYFFSAAGYSGDSSVAITGDVTINGNCSSNNSGSSTFINVACFFSASYSSSSVDSSFAITGDVTINGNCISSSSSGPACFFSVYNYSPTAIPITMGSVEFSSSAKITLSGMSGYKYFFYATAASSSTITNFLINSATFKTDTANGYPQN
ncbi:hypothetical protein FACS1894166_06700 [Bacilli bacterium]|nr:hypothetical protein FACS1894166_06700 [Bacilli bacterium]